MRELDLTPDANAGGAAGGLSGKAIAERIDPTVEDSYWRSSYSSRSYVDKGARYDDYGPAYRYGYEKYPRYHGRKFDNVQHELARDWERVKGASRLTWDQAKPRLAMRSSACATSPSA